MTFTKPPFLFEFLTAIGAVACLIYLWLIFSTVFTAKLRNESNFFLVSLSASELLCLVWLMIHINHGISSQFPKGPMLLMVNASMTGGYSYFLNSAVVAADRYFKIAKPMMYLRLMSNKLCACIILALWGLMVIVFVGLTVASSGDIEKDFISLFDIWLNQKYSKKIVVMLDIFVCPSLLAMAGFVIGLVHIARSQRRKIDAERVNLGNIAQNSETHSTQAVDLHAQPARPRSNTRKSTWYLCIYFATFVSALAPNNIMFNIAIFEGETFTAPIWIVAFILVGISLLQMVLGAIFLAYTQSDHRAVLSEFCKTIINKIKCK